MACRFEAALHTHRFFIFSHISTYVYYLSPSLLDAMRGGPFLLWRLIFGLFTHRFERVRYYRHEASRPTDIAAGVYITA